MKKDITGTMINYYFICKRKLWYFADGIGMEGENEDVCIGKIIDEQSYKREKKNVMIDEVINIDCLQSWKIVHEVKKSRKLDAAGRWQLLYYIWILRKKGIPIEKGILDYPLLKKREEIYLTEESEAELIEVLDKIKEILDLKLPPAVINKQYCKKCAYYEFCYI